MGKVTEISWCDSTFNAFWGCVEVSPECDHCYARDLSKRFGFDIWGKDKGRRTFGEKYWDQLITWDFAAQKTSTSTRVFWNSMSDLMEDRRDLDEWREKAWQMMSVTPFLTHLLLTKRPQNYMRLLPIAERPLKNVHFGTTVGVKSSLWRIQELWNVPGVRFLSCEPLLEDLGKIDLAGIHQVIVGGESGPGARPMHPDWARSVRNQCVAADVPFYFKQWGEFCPLPRPFSYHRYGTEVKNNSGYRRALSRYAKECGATQIISPGQLSEGILSECVQYDETAIGRVGKHAAGNLLDGRTWAEFPDVKGEGR